MGGGSISHETRVHMCVRRFKNSWCVYLWVKTESSGADTCVLVVTGVSEQTLLLPTAIRGRLS